MSSTSAAMRSVMPARYDQRVDIVAQSRMQRRQDHRMACEQSLEIAGLSDEVAPSDEADRLLGQLVGEEGALGIHAGGWLVSTASS